MARPRKKLTKEHIALIEENAGLGLTQEEIASLLPVTDRTLRRRIEEGDEEVLSAYARGRSKYRQRIKARLSDIALNRDGDTPVGEQRKAIEFIEKTQFGAAEKQQIEHSGGGIVVKIIGEE